MTLNFEPIVVAYKVVVYSSVGGVSKLPANTLVVIPLTRGTRSKPIQIIYPVLEKSLFTSRSARVTKALPSFKNALEAGNQSLFEIPHYRC